MGTVVPLGIHEAESWLGRSSDSDANPGDEIRGESSSGTNSSFTRNLTKVGPQLEKKLVLIECRVMEPI